MIYKGTVGKGKGGKGVRKKSNKVMAAVLAGAMTVALLSGCATRATPENLLRDMEKNAEKTESALLNFTMSVVMSDESEEAGFSMDMDMESTTEPEASHGKGTVSLDMSGMSFEVEAEMYSVEEDDQYVTYTMMEDQWTREVSDAKEITGEVDGIAESMAEYADQFTLAEELVTVNDQDCFELTGELDGDIFSEIMQTDMIDSLGDYGIDGEMFSGRAFPCTIDIYKDSILPARIYFDMADTLAPLFEGVDVNVTECYVDVTFMEYDSVGEITVPDEAVSQAVDITDESLDLPADDSGLYESDVTPAEPVETDEALGDSWESYTVQINDTVITLPCSMSDLEAAGVALDTEYTPEDYVVNAGEFELAWFEDTSGDSIMVDMTNTGEEAAAIRDCQVSSICADAYSLSNGSLKVIFPGGIQIGSTEGDLLEAYGEPDDTYEDEEYGNSHFWYGDGSYMSSCNASITPDSGLVEMITIDCEG